MGMGERRLRMEGEGPVLMGVLVNRLAVLVIDQVAGVGAAVVVDRDPGVVVRARAALLRGRTPFGVQRVLVVDGLAEEVGAALGDAGPVLVEGLLVAVRDGATDVHA